MKNLAFKTMARALFALTLSSFLALSTFLAQPCSAQDGPTAGGTLAEHAKMLPIGGTGWAKSSVNATVFRTNSLISRADVQYVAFYDGNSNVVLAKRRLGATDWELKTTPYKGSATDAHNAISIAIDGSGILHMVWDLHNQKLRYVRSKVAGGLDLTDEMPMTGQDENKVTYPQFYNTSNGDLLFLYREGSSGNGNAMLNRYDLKTQTWKSVQHPLVAGEGQRNAYLNNLAIDSKGGIHLSWVWRDTPDVATNHDVCYAYSPDEGLTWQKSTGEKYKLPITIDNAEVAFPVAKNSELINQTSMTVDSKDHPVIATYWRPAGTEVPQYQLVWFDGQKWQQHQVTMRTQGFRLSGAGTKKIPISRPLVIAGTSGEIYVVFRDEERGNGASIAISLDASHVDWKVVDLSTEPLGAWEPTYDPALWQQQHLLNLFMQRVGQGDSETLENVPPQHVSILEWTP